MQTYPHHTKDELRKELADVKFQISNPLKYKRTWSEKNALLAKRDHLLFLIRTRKY